MNRVIALLSVVSLGAATAPEPRVSIESTLVLKVSDCNKTADSIIAATERLHGYFTSRSDGKLRLRVPREQSHNMLHFIETMGVLVDRGYSATDRGDDLAEQRMRLSSRMEVLDRYFDVLSKADANNVVQVETEISNLIAEIEELEGSIRFIEHQLAYAEIVVQFKVKDRRAPTRNGNSSFAWLNSLNLVDLMEDFAHGN